MAVSVTGGDGSLFFAAGIDLTGFDRDLNSMLNSFEQLTARVRQLAETMRLNPSLDTKQVLLQVSEIEVALSKATAAGFDTAPLYAQMDALRKDIAAKPASLHVTPDTSDFDTLKTRIAALSEQLRINPHIDISEVLTEIKGIETAIAKAGASGIDTAPLLAQLETLRRGVAQDPISVNLTIDTTALEAIKLRISELSNQLRLNPTMDTAALLPEIKNIEAAMAKATAAGFDTGRLFQQLEALRKQIAGEPIAVPFTVGTVDVEALKLRISSLSDELRLNPKMDITALLDQIKTIRTELDKATAVGLNTGRIYQQLQELERRIPKQPISIPIVVDAKNVTESIETLRAKLAVRQQSLIEEKDLDRIAAYNKEIEELRLQITRLNNVGKSGFGDQLQKDMGVLEELQKRTKDLQLRISTSGSLDEIAKLNAELQQVQAEAARVANAGKAGFDAFGNAIKPDLGLLDELNAKLATLRAQAGSAKNPVDLASFNAEIQATEARIKDLSNAGKAGFDEMGRQLRTQEGLLQRLQREAAIYKRGIESATLPENIAKYNSKLEGVNVEISKLSNAGKTGFDNLGNGLEKTAGKAGLLQKSFGFFRDAANYIPGIGIAGIIALISDAVIQLVTDLLKGKNGFNELAEKMRLFNEVSKEANKQASSQITDLKVLYQVATDTTQSMTDRLNAVKALKAEFPDTFKNLKDEIVLNGQAKTSYDELAASILATSRARAAKSKLDEIEAQRLDIEFQRQKIQAATDREKAAVTDVSGRNFAGEKVLSDKSIAERKAYDLRVIEQRKKAALDEQDVQDKRLESQAGFLVKFAGGEKKVAEIIEANNKPSKNKAETDQHEKVNDLIAKRIALLQQIEGLRRDGVQSGLIKEASELDRVNEKYDKLRDAAIRFNAEVDKASSKNKVDKISISDIESLRTIEANNTLFKQQARDYKTRLDEQKRVYAEYEEARVKIGTDAAQNLFREQTKYFKSFDDLLKAEQAKLVVKVLYGKPNIGDIENLRTISKEIADNNKKLADNQKQNYVVAFQAAQTLNQKLLKIDEDYAKQKAAIESKYTGADKVQVLANLEADKQKSIDAAKDEVFQKTAVYRELSQNVIRFTREQLRAQIAATEEVLKNAKNISPELRKTLEDSLKGLKADLSIGTDESYTRSLEARKAKILDVLKNEKLSTEEYKKQKQALADINEELDKANKENRAGLEKTVGITQDLAQGFASLADTIAPFNQELSNKFASIGDSLNIAADATKAFLTGNPQDIIKLITDLAAAFAKVKQSAIDARNAVAEFNTNRQISEEDAVLRLRDEMRQQAELNRLKTKGIEDENKLLAEQRNANTAEYNKILRQIQNEQFIAGQHTERNRGSIFGGLVGYFAGTRTNVVNEMQSLAGKSFEQLQVLFDSGQLTDKAKALFEQLQKLKQEGIDIDEQLKSLQEETDRIFTGTSTSELTNSLKQMFAEGKTSAQDFADFFQDAMKKAALSVFEYKELQPVIDAFFKEFAAASESDQQLTGDEIADLQKTFTAAEENLKKKFDQLKQITGLDLGSGAGGTDTNTPKGSIKAQLTEETGTVIAGNFSGLRLTAIEQLNIAKISLDYHQQTAVNTARTFQELAAMRGMFVNGTAIVQAR